MSFRAQGMRAWLLQRLTAIYIAIYALSLTFWILQQNTMTHEIWLTLFSHPLTLIATMLFYLSIFIHAWVGMRDILLDYVKPNGVRFVLLSTLALFLVVMTLWLLIIVIGLVKV